MCVYSQSMFMLRGASNRGHRTDEAEMKDGKEHFWNMTQACLHVDKSFRHGGVHSWSLIFAWRCVYTVQEYFLRHLLMSFMEADIYIVWMNFSQCWCTSCELQSHLFLRLFCAALWRHYILYVCVLMHIISLLINEIVYRLIHYTNNWKLSLHCINLCVQKPPR